MSIARPLAAGLLAALLAFLVVHASGCGTDAVGVDECRDIEYARCEAARYCALIDNTDQAMEACKRFYRDQCLHGLASGERPGGPRVKDCVDVITKAGACARDGTTDVASCTLPDDTKTTLTKVCDIVREPEKVSECDFLYKPVEVPDASPDVEAEAEAGGDGATE